MSLLATIFAEDPAPATDQAQPGPFGNPLFFMLIMGIFLVTMIWLPARRQRREQDTMQASLKRGSKVVTAAGLIGTIVKIEDNQDEVVLRSEDTKFKVTRSSVVRLLGHEDDAK